MSIDDVDQFWSWFVTHEPSLRSALETNQTRLPVFVALDSLVRSLDPGLRWEVGPGIGEPLALTISPGGVRDRLLLAEAIVSRAPGSPGWEFHAGRPAKQWDRQFNLGGGAVRVDVDASEWRYSLVMFGGGTFFDITLFVGDSLDGLNGRSRLSAAYLVLDGELGERTVIERIGAVAVETSARAGGPTGHIADLREHLATLAR